ncbi:MAG: helix-turn-helix transcriptional regulator [Sandaracinaceae bacterium]|nr:helix-turn-helix transcriptional regulator [Sandaracinaceae bacterium]
MCAHGGARVASGARVRGRFDRSGPPGQRARGARAGRRSGGHARPRGRRGGGAGRQRARRRPGAGSGIASIASSSSSAPSGAGALEDRVERAATAWCLTARQREILDRTARGMSNKEIASVLGCAEVTVENHLTAIFRKAAVDGRNRLLVKLTTL